MSTPKEMKVVLTYDDGSKKEVKYTLSPLRSGDNPHQAGYIGEPGNSYTRSYRRPRHGLYQPHRPERLRRGRGNQ